jgi:hypothetical protein
LWDEGAGVYYEVAGEALVSEHAQCLAILSGIAQPSHIAKMQQALLNHPDMARTTIYFSHYLFETYRTMGAIDQLLQRMQLWFDLPARTSKRPSKCPNHHAQIVMPGAHIPCSITMPPWWGCALLPPALPKSPSRRNSASCNESVRSPPTPTGHIHSAFWRDHGILRGRVTLPAGVSGVINLPKRGSAYPRWWHSNTLK